EPPDGAEPYAARAVRMLSMFDTDLSGIDVGSEILDKVTIHTSAALVMFSQALDFAAPVASIDRAQYDAMKMRLLDLARSFNDAYWVRMPYLMQLWQNNHTIKAATGIGMPALLFPETRESRLWLENALSIIDQYALNTQSCGGSGWAEGPGYYEYTMINLRPFGLAWHRYSGGKEITVKRRCAGIENPCTEGGPLAVPDILFSPQMRGVSEDFMQGLLMYNGYVANIDDSDFVSYNFFYDAYLYGSQPALWCAKNSTTPMADGAFDAADTLLIYDPSLEPSAPPSPPAFHGGYARLHAGDARNDLTVYLVGESGAMRKNGMGHEQPDNQSLIVTFGGELWIIDSGYSGYPTRGQVALDVNHSVILVDGKGGPTDPIKMHGTDNDADLRVADASVGIPNAYSELTRGGAKLGRSVFVADGRTVLVMDVMEAYDGASHDYTLLFHTNGGGTTGGITEPAGNGATIKRGGYQMSVSTVSDGVAVTPALELYKHSFLRHADPQETHIRLASSVPTSMPGARVMACTTFRLYPGTFTDDPALGITVTDDGPVTDSGACPAAGVLPDGSITVYIVRSKPSGEGCFTVTHPKLGTKKTCTSGSLASVTF
ncbi:MAG: heparinase II/III family protein, partial [Myxococcota bacterium]